MRIPDTAPAFDRPTLLVVSDVSHALFFTLRNQELKPVGEIAIDYPPKENDERVSIQIPGGMHAAEESENLGMEKIRRFSHQLAEELHRRLQEGEYEEIFLTGSQEHVQQFLNALHPDVRSRVTKTLHKQITKEPPLKILERFYKKTA